MAQFLKGPLKATDEELEKLGVGGRAAGDGGGGGMVVPIIVVLLAVAAYFVYQQQQKAGEGARRVFPSGARERGRARVSGVTRARIAPRGVSSRAGLPARASESTPARLRARCHRRSHGTPIASSTPSAPRRAAPLADGLTPTRMSFFGDALDGCIT